MNDEQRSSPPRPSRTSDRETLAVSSEEALTIAEAVDALESTETGPAPYAVVDPYLGKTIDGRYLVEGVLGEGGMGVVYRGRHKVIDKRVAIKVLRGDLAKEPEITERFLQEARAASAIGNSHIVDISDFGQLPDGATYFVMEYLDGKSLSAVIEQARPIPVARLCHIGKQIALGLAAAHTANIVHRDLKPDNVMLIQRGVEKDFVKILDFGIAKVGGQASQKTRAGSVFGTPHYMSPEQAAGTPVDHRTDIYALGVIFYEMASGRVPFDADNFMGILTQHMYKAPVPIRALVPPVDVPPGLEAIILKCLTKKPEGRYGNMEELIRDLEQLERGVPPDAVHEMMARSGSFNVPADYFRSPMPAPLPATPLGLAPPKRWPLYAAMGGVATVVGVVAMILVANAGRGKAQPIAVATQGAIPSLTLPSPSAAPAASSAAPAPSTSSSGTSVDRSKLVLVGVSPGDAKVARDGEDLGTPPVALYLAPGEKASLVITRDGYKTEAVTVDAEDEKRTVTLKPVGTATKGRSPGKTGAGAPAPSVGGAIDDVGDPFQKKR